MADTDRIPMLVLGGWLGSGKTTVLNQLLRSAGRERIAVIVNDLGEVNVDAALVRAWGQDTIELTNGCICCSIGASLAVTLRDLVLAGVAPERIVIEASGVADPAQVAAYGDRRRIRVDAVVVTVDATHVVRAAAHPTYGQMVRHQAAAADLILLTKTDVATVDELREARRWCETTAPEAAVLDGPLADCDAAAVLGHIRPSGPDADPSRAPNPALIVSTWRPAAAVSRASVEEFLSAPGVVRAKGVITIIGAGRCWVHKAGTRIEITPPHPDTPHPDIAQPDALTLITEASFASPREIL